MKENIENILVNWLYSDEGEDDPLDLDALAWELDKLFREEIASIEDSIDPYGPDTLDEKFM